MALILVCLPFSFSAGAEPKRDAFSGYPAQFNLGRAATAAEIARWDLDVRPDGRGLPSGRGTVAQGATVYLAKCVACHGPQGEGMPNLGPRLISQPGETYDFGVSAGGDTKKTIGSYWPYASTIFDYTRRSMPLNAPGTLSADELYAVTAYLLARNGVVAESAVMDAQSLPRVRMPAQPRFVPDDRLDTNQVR